MKVVVQDGGVYFPVGNNEYVCIGSVAEVKEAGKERLVNMVLEAIAISQFNELSSSGVKH